MKENLSCLGKQESTFSPKAACGTDLQGDAVGVARLQLRGEITIRDVLQKLLKQQESSWSHLRLSV